MGEAAAGAAAGSLFVLAAGTGVFAARVACAGRRSGAFAVMAVVVAVVVGAQIEVASVLLVLGGASAAITILDVGAFPVQVVEGIGRVVGVAMAWAVCISDGGGGRP